MSLTQGGVWLGSRKKGCVRNRRAWPITGHWICQVDQCESELLAKVDTIESQLAQITQLLFGCQGPQGFIRGQALEIIQMTTCRPRQEGARNLGSRDCRHWALSRGCQCSQECKHFQHCSGDTKQHGGVQSSWTWFSWAGVGRGAAAQC